MPTGSTGASEAGGHALEDVDQIRGVEDGGEGSGLFAGSAVAQVVGQGI